jgi:hypothetical protein
MGQLSVHVPCLPPGDAAFKTVITPTVTGWSYGITNLAITQDLFTQGWVQDASIMHDLLGATGQHRSSAISSSTPTLHP